MIPSRMNAVVTTSFGGPEVLQYQTVATPTPGPTEVLIRTAAVGFNRADVSQREGRYPPPPGVSDLLGLECSGVIVEVGNSVTRFQVGDRVCALLGGGGYAAYVSVPEEQVLDVPESLDLIEAAGVVEVACTVWSNFALGVPPGIGQSVLIHGGSGGLGSFAVQYAALLGAEVFATAGSLRGVEHCIEQGASAAWNYRETDFVDEILRETDQRGVNLILDPVGGAYLQRNMNALAVDGRLAIVATLEGTAAECDLRQLMVKRLTIHGTTLRARPVTGIGSKAEIVERVRAEVWPFIEQRRLRLAPTFRMRIEEARQLHEAHRDGELPPGKAVLVVDDQLK